MVDKKVMFNSGDVLTINEPYCEISQDDIASILGDACEKVDYNAAILKQVLMRLDTLEKKVIPVKYEEEIEIQEDSISEIVFNNVPDGYLKVEFDGYIYGNDYLLNREGNLVFINTVFQRTGYKVKLIVI